MNRLQILRAILLLGAGATVVGVAGYRYSKSSAVKASPAPRVVAAVAPGSGLKEAGENGKTINLAATGKGETGAQTSSNLQAFRDRITKARGARTRAKCMALLSEAVQTLDPSQIREALAEVEAMKDYRFRSQLRGMLISRWGESDPKAALAYAQGLEGKIGEKRYSSNRDFSIDGFSMTPLFDSWLKKDFYAAKAWMEGLPADSWFRKGLLPSLVFSLAQRDPAAALSLARSSDEDQKYALGWAVDGWSLKDTDAAIAYVAQLPDYNKISILESMILTLGPKNPDKAINLLEQLPAGDQKYALLAFANNWGQSDPKAALDWANQQTNPDLKSRILSGVISGMAQKDPDRALELARSLPAEERHDSMQNICYALSKSDPIRALDLAQSLPAERRDTALYNFLKILSESDPKGAIEYAMNLPSSENIDSQVGVMASEWITVDPGGAIDWYASLTDPKLKGKVAVSMIGNLSQVDPDRAINLLLAMPPGDAQNQALAQIGKYWGRTDQKAALDWANQQTDPAVKSRILEGVIEGVEDGKEAFKIAQSLLTGDSQNKIIKEVLTDLACFDPQSAIVLASGIPNADDRSKAQQNVVRIWMRNDSAAATQWVNSSSLPQDVKARLLQQK
ncbi:MAG: hypothetical protein RLZZ408_415 [Verrucomicrobiota bacterium]